MTTTPGDYPVGTTSGPAGASRGYAPYSRDPSGVGAPGYGERSSMSDATGRYGESADSFRRSYRAGFASATDQPMPGMSGAPGPTASADQVNVTALLKAVQDLQATVSQLQRDVQALRQGAESTTKP